ncbi:MAG TPA: GNAT family N-acetyltransferase [Ktedonobacteraceae bacterium]|jgi:diamine N-acetyltransferase|nr:GNAT family N-acetyltransferase [Ktedonobacteraceae bacterium]
MEELSIREVTRENWRAALHLAVHPEQQRFIADYVPIAVIALAKAYIRPGGLLWVPYAIYKGAEMIGFMELAYEPGSQENYWLFHFFIDYRYQGQSYGKKGLEVFLQFLGEHHPQCRSLQLTVHPENHVAQHLYTEAGFKSTGELLDNEPVYRLALSSIDTSRSDFQDALAAYHAIEPSYREANRRLAE